MTKLVLVGLAVLVGCGKGTGGAGGAGGAAMGAGGKGGAHALDAGSHDTSSLDASSLDTGLPDMGSPPKDAGPVVCPTKPPFDESDQALVSACTRSIVVGVGNALRRADSFDGQTWNHDVTFPNTNSDQNENSHRDVAIANGLIVIVGDAGLLVSTDSGATYANPIATQMHDSTITFFKGAFWAVTSAGTFSSSDGVSWTQWPGTTSLPGNLPGTFSGSSSATDGAHLVVVDSRDTTYRIFDGATWTQPTLSAGFGQLGPIRYGGGLFVMLGLGCCDSAMYAGLRAVSSDAGKTFTLVTNASPGAGDDRFGDLLWNGTAFFATASQYDNRGYDSTDGLVWTAHNMSVEIGAVALLGGALIGANSATLYRSTDEENWTMTHVASGDADWGFTRLATGRVLNQ